MTNRFKIYARAWQVNGREILPGIGREVPAGSFVQLGAGEVVSVEKDSKWVLTSTECDWEGRSEKFWTVQ